MVQAGEVISDLPSVGESMQEDHYLIRDNISPSYAAITKKKLVDSYGSSNEDCIEQLSKKAGRKSRKEAWQDAADRLKMRGNQSTIEISFGKSKRTRPIKGSSTPSFSGK